MENSKIHSDFDNIRQLVPLNEVKILYIIKKTNEIYTNVANLLNSISYKQSYDKLNELL